MNWYLTTKGIHLLFVLSWMVGVFYLPRMLVHFKEAEQKNESTTRLQIMAHKLYHFSVMNGILAIVSGVFLVYFWFDFRSFWVYGKLLFVLILVGHFLYCGTQVGAMKNKSVYGSAIFWRIYNELAVIAFCVVIYFVLFKPL